MGSGIVGAIPDKQKGYLLWIALSLLPKVVVVNFRSYQQAALENLE